jgi:hypothetical protein
MSNITSKMFRYPRVVCVDGFEMSVQANEGAYCSPRTNTASTYEEVEVGFPNRVEPLLMEWVEKADHPTDTVYPYVPVKVVTNVIAKHGGMVEGDVPPGVVPLRASRR